MQIRIWKKVLRLKKKNDGVVDDKVVIVTLVKWDDHGTVINQEEAD